MNITPNSAGRGVRTRTAPERLGYHQLGQPTVKTPLSRPVPGNTDEQPETEDVEIVQQVTTPVPKPRLSLSQKSVRSNLSATVSERVEAEVAEDEKLAILVQEILENKTESEIVDAERTAVMEKIALFDGIALSRVMSEVENHELLKMKFSLIDLNKRTNVLSSILQCLEKKHEIQTHMRERKLKLLEELQEETDDSRSAISSQNTVSKWVQDVNENNATSQIDHSTSPIDTGGEQGLMIQILQRQLQLMQRPSSDAARSDKELPKFNGCAEDWAAFKSEYDRTTTNYRIGNSENLRRLRKAVNGTALEVVKSLMANPENVPTIMSTLELHFGRPEQIIRTLIKKARETKSPDVNKPETWIQYAIAVQSLVVNIKTYSMGGFYLNDRYLLDELVDKLPVSMQKEWLIWSSSGSKMKRDLDNFSNWMNLQRETACTIAKIEVKSASDDDSSKKKRKPGVHGVAEEIRKCSCCSKTGHTIVKCYQFKKMPTDERWNTVKKERLCFTCLEEGHSSNKCTVTSVCEKDGCEGKHHLLLHRAVKPKSTKPVTEEKEDVEVVTEATPPPSKINAVLSSETLPIIQVKLEGPNGTKNVFALLDSGASCSILEENIATQLGLDGDKAPFNFTVFGNEVRENPTSMSVVLKVSGVYRRASSYEMKNVRTVRKLGILGCDLNADKLRREYPHLRKMKARNLNNARPQMIIGFDASRLIAAREILEDGNKPVAFRSLLGWYVSTGKSGKNCYYINEGADMDVMLHNEMKEFFTTEGFGVKVFAESNRSIEDKRALSLLHKDTIKINGQWQTGLLWGKNSEELPESYSMAERRLFSMERKMDRDPKFAELVMEKFEDYVKKGYLVRRISDVTSGDVAGIGSNSNKECGLATGGDKVTRIDSKGSVRKWYLPWFFAYHPSKKPRLVFDAAARSQGMALNDFLVKGPDLLQSLPGVLMRFRRHQVAITGDIKEMFHRVSLKPEDRSCQIVLYRGMNRKGKPIEYEMSVLFFGSASSPCSAIFAKDTNAKEYEENYSTAVQAILFDHYMDDYLGGAETEKEAALLRRQVSYVHGQGGFEMVKWNSSSSFVLKTIPENLRAREGVTLMDKSETYLDKTLGIIWNPAKDQFQITVNFGRIPVPVAKKERRPTKREIASIIMSLYDPLGFLCPVKVKALVILQRTWQVGIGWDDEIPTEIEDRWNEWLNELSFVDKITIPRRMCTVSIDTCDVQMHVFTDASEEAFTSVIFLRFNTGGSTQLSFVCGKVRVSQPRKLTIPRMELQGAVMGVRLALAVVKAFNGDIKLTKTVYWTDSKTVLCWLRSTTQRYGMFISNRVGEIQEGSDVSNWRWIPSKLNVADDATRSGKTDILTTTSRWLIGPSFLLENETEWPTENKSETIDSVDKFELEICHVNVVSCNKPSDVLPEISKFCSWIRLIRCTATVIAACRRFRKMGPCEVTIDDVKKAEMLWIKKSQMDSFPIEVKCLKAGDEILRQSKLAQLSPAMTSDGVIVLDGRIKAAQGVSETVKSPPILDSRHPYAEMFIRWHHYQSKHFGQERVINEIRQHVWILNCREAVRRCWANCLLCKLRRAKPLTPKMGQLPFCRLESGTAPFHNTGVDYFGPYSVTVNRHSEKRWGALFTCLATRAVHLEIAESLDTNDMVNALVRFMNIRGTPEHIWSDNGTNFVGANREIKESYFSWKENGIVEAASSRLIQWHYVSPASPHMAGSWERLVGCTKKILEVILKEQKPREGTLRTLFSEVMNILNSRPITDVPWSHEDSECLTPNHLLKLKCVQGPTIPGDYSENQYYTKTWRYAQHLADEFWRRWSREYLPQLAKRQNWFKSTRQLQIGDLVLLVDDTATRNHWKRGVIVKTFPAKDGQTRIVEVKIASVDPDDPTKKVKCTTLRRPAVKVCPIGLDERGTTVPGRENVAEEQTLDKGEQD